MTRYAYCHFCDDIRYENGFKNSLMGIYGSELLVEQMPTVIPKLCIVAFCCTPSERRFESMAAKIFHGEKLIQEQSIPKEDLIRMQDQLSQKDTINEPLEKYSIGFNITIPQLLIEAPSILRVVMVADSEEYTAGKLRIKLLEPSKS